MLPRSVPTEQAARTGILKHVQHMIAWTLGMEGLMAVAETGRSSAQNNRSNQRRKHSNTRMPRIIDGSGKVSASDAAFEGHCF